MFAMANKRKPKGGGKDAGGGGYGSNDRNGVRWTCNRCSTTTFKMYNWGKCCNNCGFAKHMCVVNPRAQNGLGRDQKPIKVDTPVRKIDPTIAGKGGKGGGKGKGDPTNAGKGGG